MPTPGAAARLRILVVEDEPTNRLLLHAVLARSTDDRVRTAQVVEAETLGSARDLLRRGRWDILLLDVRLPDGNGLDLVADVKTGASGDGADRPGIVVLSASVLPEDRAAALETGCDAFLGKPFRPDELLGLLSDMAADRPSAYPV
jgi:two-component system KDP operon response regulator KdpE